MATKHNRGGGLVHVPRGGELERDRGDLDFEAAALAVIAAKRSPHTQAAYRADLAKWLEFCDKHRSEPAGASLPLTTAFRESLKDDLGNESIRRVLASMSSIYHTLLRGRAVRANPFHPDVLDWPTPSALPKARLVTDAQALAMIENTKYDKDSKRGARDAAVLRLLYDTGLRRMSVAAIKRETYRGDSVQAIVKGGKEAEIVLPEECIECVNAWLTVAPRSEWFFPGLRGSMNPATINKLVRRHALAVGAPHVHPHSFRAAFVTAGYDAGLPEHEIQAAVHHSDASITKRYDRHARGRMVATQVSEFRRKVKK